jgi:predicted nucleotidyltransferase
MVNRSKQKLTRLQEEILRLLFIKVGTSLNQRRIANLLEFSQPAVMKSLPGLEKRNLIILEKDKHSKIWSIELNRENREVIGLKRSDNLKQIYEFGLVNFLEEKLAGATIMLFGSYSLGEDIDRSDIDIAVIGRKPKDISLENYETKLNRKININFYDSWKEIHKHLKNNILNGIVLSGGVDL